MVFLKMVFTTGAIIQSLLIIGAKLIAFHWMKSKKIKTNVILIFVLYCAKMYLSIKQRTDKNEYNFRKRS